MVVSTTSCSLLGVACFGSSGDGRWRERAWRRLIVRSPSMPPCRGPALGFCGKAEKRMVGCGAVRATGWGSSPPCLVRGGARRVVGEQHAFHLS